ncbi:hypothetical protein JMUB7523_17970 [Staphylococcus aureus]
MYKRQLKSVVFSSNGAKFCDPHPANNNVAPTIETNFFITISLKSISIIFYPHYDIILMYKVEMHKRFTRR